MYNIKIEDSGYKCLKELIKDYARITFEKTEEENPNIYEEILVCKMLLDDLNNAEHYEAEE